MSYWIDCSDPGKLYGSSRQIPFWASRVSDIQNLPKVGIPGVQQGDDTVSCRPVDAGSTCTVIENSTLWVLDMDDNDWHQL